MPGLLFSALSVDAGQDTLHSVALKPPFREECRLAPDELPAWLLGNIFSHTVVSQGPHELGLEKGLRIEGSSEKEDTRCFGCPSPG